MVRVIEPSRMEDKVPRKGRYQDRAASRWIPLVLMLTLLMDILLQFAWAARPARAGVEEQRDSESAPNVSHPLAHQESGSGPVERGVTALDHSPFRDRVNALRGPGT